MTNRPTISIPEEEDVVVNMELTVSTYEEEAEPIHMYISPDTEPEQNPDVEMGYTEEELEEILEYWEHLHDYDY